MARADMARRGVVAFRGTVQPELAPVRTEGSDREVLGERQTGEGGIGAVARNVGEPASHRVADVGRPERRTVEGDGTRANGRGPEQHREHLLLADLRRPREPEDLAAPQREADTARGAATEVVHGEAYRPGRLRSGLRRRAHRASHDQLDQLRTADPCRFHRGHDLTVAQDGRGVGAHHLIELMRDDQHRVPLGGEVADRVPHPFGLRRRQRRGGLVEDEHPRC